MLTLRCGQMYARLLHVHAQHRSDHGGFGVKVLHLLCSQGRRLWDAGDTFNATRFAARGADAGCADGAPAASAAAISLQSFHKSC